MPSRRAYIAGIGSAAFGGVAYSIYQNFQPKSESNSAISVAEATVIDGLSRPLDIFVRPVENDITAGSTAVIEATLGWGGADAITISSGSGVPISTPHYSNSDSPGLIVLPQNAQWSSEKVSNWVIGDGEEGDLWTPQGIQIKEVSPGEYLSQKLTVWGDGKYADRIRPGAYYFNGFINKSVESRQEPDSATGFTAEEFQYRIEITRS